MRPRRNASLSVSGTRDTAWEVLRLRDSVCNFDIDTSSDRMLVGGQLCAGGVAAASISFVGTVINSATL